MSQPSQSKVSASHYRQEIIDMIRSRWPLGRVRKWLLARGEDISTRSLERFRRTWIIKSELIPETYFESQCKEMDVLIDALAEHAKAIQIQKQRCGIIFQQEAANNVIFAEGRKEMALLSHMLFNHKRMEEGIRPSINVLQQNQVGQVIEVKWLDNSTHNTVQSASAPAGVPSEHGEVQNPGVRKKMGKDGSGLQ